ncbi:2-hydroxyacid dehydrogenase [Dongia sedimenti]|uniref:Glyoxylate/hydroxypyruvate reductase A n=1 Tax=Dongia sedimenti TaxID=3064282 RepID=A0ABU0YRN8_9PROT|nr:glyoxylate/hydroxypyruvate reductase A [Rhodospirillaceae bacterium R-7]
MSTRLVLSDTGAKFAAWESAFHKAAPELGLVHDEPSRDLSGIRYCMTWKPLPGVYDRMPDLEALFVLGAGVERFLADAAIPPRVRIVKMAEPGLTQAMEHYVLWQVLDHHRRFWELEAAQREARWIDQTYPAPWERKVGVMGLGALGEAVARVLRSFGFDTRGWSRSAKAIDGVTMFAGAERIDAFLDGLEILVCLLPLTAETRGILNADLFRRLAPGAGLINVGRGAQLNEADLLSALESGQLTAASLDVFAAEPLPPKHPFWRHPRIFVTPHLAADVDPESAALAIQRQIRRFEAGQALEHVADRTRGY